MKVLYPVDKNTLTGKFGVDFSLDPIFKDFYTLFDGKHPGVDFTIPVGTEIKASISGVVVRVENNKGMGQVLATRNGNIYVLYAHLSEIFVKLGQVVKQNGIIAKSGNTGFATTGPHLHFEMRNLSIRELKDTIFDPPFEKNLVNFTETFVYKVNNENNPKNLKILAERYFGDEKYWKKIAKQNKLNGYSPETPLIDKMDLIIPNYE